MLSQFPTKPNLQTKQNQYKLPIFINRYFMLNIIYIYMPSKISLAVLCLLLALMQTSYAKFKATQYTYQMYKNQFGKSHTSQEDNLRKTYFNQNIQYAIRMEELGVEIPPNTLLDWSPDQLAGLNGLDPTGHEVIPYVSRRNVASDLPQTLDYRSLDAVSGVRSQGNCGSCWVFSAIAQYQTLLILLNQQDKSIDISEQFAMECTSGDACNGGWPTNVFKGAHQNGFPTETNLPYAAQQSNICPAPNAGFKKINANIVENNAYSMGSVDQVKQLLVDNGPQQVAVYAGHSSFYNPNSDGEINCPYGGIDHAVFLVGYTSSHWIIKNSWGTGWGLNGYGLIPFDNDCRLKQYVFHVTVDQQFTPPDPNPNPDPDPNPTPDPVGTITLIIEMYDSWGDGWNGNILGFAQGASIVATFGESFTDGFSATKSVNIPTKVSTDVVVQSFGTYQNEISFMIKFNNGSILYEYYAQDTGAQEQTLGFSMDQIFFTFCIDCDDEEQQILNYRLFLTDQWCDGWKGNTIVFTQQGTTYEVGADFTYGNEYGPIQLAFVHGIEVTITPGVLADFRQQIGFYLRDQFGFEAFRREHGEFYDATTIIGTFVPGGVNLRPVILASQQTEQSRQKLSLVEQSNPQSTIQDSEENQQNNSLMIVVICLSVVNLLVLGIVIFTVKKISKISAGKKCEQRVGTQSSLEGPNDKRDIISI